ncbi:MAG: SMC-Scp complex subunit ScpB [Acidobacteria bacterium]|uniref:SMC-Scp complex subunit ScpB n=1 Tax=Candidatus Polarisedimenticola svalbardensis TaxID=2886004 RepID=A0A8J6Y6H5_9BACT|nr:SMC-Scp complex subunit ScpB [Candidatus Polarisedimenticola svalbardensis]
MTEKPEERPPAELLESTLEAIIFASTDPVRPAELGTALGGIPDEEVVAALESLSSRYARADTGLILEQVAGGYRLATRSNVGAWVRTYFRNQNRTRLTPATLETLAIVAYRQPVTAPEIQAIRGKDPTYGLKVLLEKRMLRIMGRKKVVGNPLLYGTSRQFLVHFGLNSLKDLPSIEEFDAFLDTLGQAQPVLFEGAEIAEPADTVAAEPTAAEPATIPEPPQDTPGGGH